MNASITELQRKNHTAILKAMATVGQAKVAELIGVSPTTVSRLKDEDLERLSAILAACNLVAQPRSFKSVDPERLRALTVLARDSLDQAADSQFGSATE